MNAQTPINPRLVISSRIIADLTQLQHTVVLRDIRTMVSKLCDGSTRVTESSYKDSRGRTFPAMEMGKRDCMILVSSYNAERRAAVIDWWMMAEAAAATAPIASPIAVPQVVAVDRAGVATIVDAPTEKAVQASFNLLSVDVPPASLQGAPATASDFAKLPEPCEGRIGGALVQTVNARDLHRYLGNRDHFATWIKDRIRKYEFRQGTDFVVFSESSEKGRPSDEYALTLDMAKELAMVERNEKGKEARRYYIECERKLREQPRASLLPDLSNEDAVLRYILEQAQGRLADRDRAAAAEAKAEEVGATLDVLSASEGSICLQTAGKTLGLKRCNDIFGIMELESFIFRRLPSKTWIAHQSRLESKHLDQVARSYKDRDGSDCIAY